LFDVVLDHLPQLLPTPEAPVLAAIDDTILKKTGRRIPGVKILRDPMSPAFHVNFCYGLRFVQISVLVSPRDAAGPARALPVRFDFAPPAHKPRKNAPPEDWDNYKEEQKKRTLSLAGVEAITSLRASLDQRPETRQRQLIVSGDGSYTNHTVLPRLPERTTGLRKAQGAEASLLQHLTSGAFAKTSSCTFPCQHPAANHWAARAAMVLWRPRRNRFSRTTPSR
jgi:hypothetical protein